MEMMAELGYCSGIENYSRIISDRPAGSAPMTLLDFFPDDFLLFVDESHVTLPQVRAMYNGDHARKDSLVQYGFRLPCAYDNRPLRFEEFEDRIGQAVFVSATPGPYERERADQVVEQVIRPTGLLDPKVEVRPVEGQIDDLMDEIRARAARDERVLVTTLTKKMAEDLTEYLKNAGIRVRYMHSDVQTIERMEIIRSCAGRVRRAGGHQPAAGGPGPAGGVPGGHPGRGQGGLSPLRDQPHPDHRPGGPERRRHGHHVRRRDHALHAGGHRRDGAPPVHPGRLQQGARHRAQDHHQGRPGGAGDLQVCGGGDRQGRKKRRLTDQERAAEIARLEKEMKEASKMLEFEYAAVLRDRIIELRGEK